MTRRVRRRMLLWAAATLAVTTAGMTQAAFASPVRPASTVYAPTVTTSSPTYVVGTPVAITFTADTYGDTPVAFGYQVDDQKSEFVPADSGHATIEWTPYRRTSIFDAWSIGSDGSLSAKTTKIFLANAAAPAADHDLDGNGRPDLVTGGNTDALASGIWLAPAPEQATLAARGVLDVPAVNIGQYGTNGTDPETFDDAQLITGNFSNHGFQDVLAYYPTGYRAGGALLLVGSGDGSALRSQYSGNLTSIADGTFTDMNGDDPIEVANAYDSSGRGAVYCDLIAVVGSQLNGYYLAYYPNYYGAGAWPMAVQLPNATPTGGVDWDNWTIATAQVPTGTAMFLWNRSTGDLFLWEGLVFSDNGDQTGTISYTQYKLSDDWNTGVALSTVQASDFTADGVPDLWTVTPAGTVTAYVVSGLSTAGTGIVTAQEPQQLG